MSRRRLMAASCISHIALVALILFYEGPRTTHGVVQLSLPPARLLTIMGYGDDGSYLKAAVDLAHHGSVGPSNWWILNLWPPGMTWTDALALKFSPFPLGVSVAMLTAVVWGLALALVTWPLVRERRFLWLVALVELLLLATPPFQSWMFDEGVLYADGLSSAVLLIGIALIVIRGLDGGPTWLWVRDGLLAGVGFAMSVYYRSSNDLVPAFIGVLGLVMLGVLVVRRRSGKVAGQVFKGSLAITLIAALTTAILLVPYTAFVHSRFQRYGLTSTEDLSYQDSWASATVTPEWEQQSGLTIGCDLDPVECAKLAAQKPAPTDGQYRDALLMTVLKHPVGFLKERVSIFVRQWFGDDLAWYNYTPTDYMTQTPSYSSSRDLNIPMGLAYLGLLATALWSAVRLAVRGRWALWALPVAVLALLAPFSFFHIEVRYLIPFKVMGFLAPTVVAAWMRERGTPVRSGASNA